MQNLEKTKKKATIKVRVYVQITVDKTWTDWHEIGTGYIDFISDLTPDDQANNQFLVVKPLANQQISQLSHKIHRGKHPNYILYSKLEKINNYELSESTIITWQDRILNYCIAITFIQKQHRQEYWRIICSKIGKNHLEIGNLSPNDILEDPCEFNLNTLMKNVKNRQDLITYHVINKTTFMPALKSLVNRLQSKPIQGLKCIYIIINNIISYNDTRILSIFFSSQYFEMYLKILAVSPSNTKNLNYVQIYKQRQLFGTIVPFSKEFTAKIIMQHNIAFHNQYILNIRTEADFLNFMTKFQNKTILELIEYLRSKSIMKELNAKMQTDFLRVLIFLSELIVLIKQIQDIKSYDIIDAIYQSNILDTLSKCGYNDELMRGLQDKLIMYFEVIGHLGLFAQKMYLDFMKSNHNSQYSLMSRFIKAFLSESMSIKKVITHFFKMEFLSHLWLQRKEWIQFLLTTFIKQVIQSIGNYDVMDDRTSYKENLSHTLECLLDFTMVLIQISFKYKIYKMYQKYNLIELAIKIFKTKTQKIMLLEFFRQIITKKEYKEIDNVKDLKPVSTFRIVKDHQIINSIIKSGVIDFFIEMLKKNYKKNSLITCICMEILNIIIAGNYQALIKVFVNHKAHLPKIQLIQKILKLYDENMMNDDEGDDKDSSEMIEEDAILHKQDHKKYLNSRLDRNQTKKLKKLPYIVHKKSLIDNQNQVAQLSNHIVLTQIQYAQQANSLQSAKNSSTTIGTQKKQS